MGDKYMRLECHEHHHTRNHNNHDQEPHGCPYPLRQTVSDGRTKGNSSGFGIGIIIGDAIVSDGIWLLLEKIQVHVFSDGH